MFTFTDLSCYIIKNYFQLTSRRIYIYSTTFYKSLDWNITGFIELIMAFGSTALRIATLFLRFIVRISFSASNSMCVKCPFSELFWSVFLAFRLNTDQNNSECGHFLRSISPYSVRMRENTDQINSEYGHFLRSGWFWYYSCRV